MELRDFIVTPPLIILLYVIAYIIRPYVTDSITRRYFIAALSVRIFGALALGFVYQFYYSGGDTYNYHTHGSRIVWQAFADDPSLGLKLLASDGKDVRDIYKYATKIPFFSDRSSFAVVKLASVFDLFTFSTYSGTAVLFSIIGFVGSWMLFQTFYLLRPYQHRLIAMACLFIPSVVFWGSGLLKDTITLACLGFCTFAVFRIFIKGQFNFLIVALLLVSIYGLYAIKIYILLTFLPAVIVWVFLFNFSKIKSLVTKLLMLPFVMFVVVLLSYLAMVKASEDNPKYSINTIAKTAQITAYDIRYWTGRNAGSGYTLGELDGTWQSMIKLFPKGVNVSLFRPYLWEVNNPLMFITALEALALLALSAYVLIKTRQNLLGILSNPTVLFCLLFSITFAFAVGVSTFNFGTLARYKIPLLSFYSLALILIYDSWKRERKLAAFERTE
jgi:hypothetical protein